MAAGVERLEALAATPGRWAALPVRPGGSGQGTAVRPFSQVLKEALAQVNQLQLEAQAQAEALARGDVQDMHQVTLAVERAQLALELTVAVRNRLLEAYQEISRIPV